MRELVPFVLLACACAAASRTAAPPSSAPAPEPVTSASAAPAPPEGFEDLAAKGTSIAPGMHVAAERAGGGEPLELVRAEASDVCVRVAFASTPAAKTSLVSSTGAVLATADAAAEGVLPEKGPVCVRKGDAVRGAAPGASHVRWVAWVGGP